MSTTRSTTAALHGWDELLSDPSADRAPALLPQLAELEAARPALAHGNRIVHGDLRADNMVRDHHLRVTFADWAHATTGPTRVDAASHAPQLILAGHTPVDIARPLRDHPTAAGRPDTTTAFLAALAGHWHRPQTRPANGSDDRGDPGAQDEFAVPREWESEAAPPHSIAAPPPSAPAERHPTPQEQQGKAPPVPADRHTLSRRKEQGGRARGHGHRSTLPTAKLPRDCVSGDITSATAAAVSRPDQEQALTPGVTSADPLSGTRSQAQEVADRLRGARWTLRDDGTPAADLAEVPLLRTTSVDATTRLLTGKRTRRTDVSATTTWMEARLVTGAGPTVRLDLVRAATGATRAVVDCREFTSTSTTAQRLSLTLGNDEESGPGERPR
ncbi:phosphotransferase [Streptomyces sp. NPDC127066]|uniref:phosphotransferase n=1 Tax=Streptomyces sp. NPDC127066 TaxID=3347125 RepID=UPI0036614060